MKLMNFLWATLVPLFISLCGTSSMAFDGSVPGYWLDVTGKQDCGSRGPVRISMKAFGMDGKAFGLLVLDWQKTSTQAARVIPTVLLGFGGNEKMLIQNEDVTVYGWTKDPGFPVPEISMHSPSPPDISNETAAGKYLRLSRAPSADYYLNLTLKGENWSCDLVLPYYDQIKSSLDLSNLRDAAADTLTKCASNRENGTPRSKEIEALVSGMAARLVCSRDNFTYLTSAGQMTQYDVSGGTCVASLLGLPLRSLQFFVGERECTNRQSGLATCSTEIMVICNAADSSRQQLDCLGQNFRIKAEAEFSYRATSCDWLLDDFKLIEGSVERN